MSEADNALEFNRLIDEKIFGHIWDKSRCKVCGWTMDSLGTTGCVEGGCSMRPAPRVHAINNIAPYSTGLVAAWRIVAKFSADPPCGEGWFISISSGASEDHRWLVRIQHSLVLREFIGEADEMPMAVCIAALKAIEIWDEAAAATQRYFELEGEQR